MAWTAYLYQTMSGQIGPKVGFSDAKWSMSLNETESLDIDLRKSDLPKVDKDKWLAPWYASVLYMWDDTPIFAGPIISRRAESFDYIYLTCAGIRSILARRFTVREAPIDPVLSTAFDYTKTGATVKFTGKSLGTIAQEVVKIAIAKPSGYLPITFPIAAQTAANDADHERTYHAFNLQNNNCDDVLTKLSNVIDGPDIMFKPKIVNGNRVVHEMWHGTEKQPRITQVYTPLWDTTVPNGPVVDMDVTATGAYQTSRVYSIGAGQDEGTIIRVNTDVKTVNEGQLPLLETYIANSSAENPAVVDGYGKARLASDRHMLQEIQIEVWSDEVNKIGTFWPGDHARIVVKDWVSLKDGVHDVRILNLNGSTDARVKMSVQTEDQFIRADNTRDDYAV